MVLNDVQGSGHRLFSMHDPYLQKDVMKNHGNWYQNNQNPGWESKFQPPEHEGWWALTIQHLFMYFMVFLSPFRKIQGKCLDQFIDHRIIQHYAFYSIWQLYKTNYKIDCGASKTLTKTWHVRKPVSQNKNGLQSTAADLLRMTLCTLKTHNKITQVI
jgi:hypothetical protein